jgi:hypothetical protein
MTGTGRDRHAGSDLSCSLVCVCKFISWSGDIMLAFRLAMIQSEPATTRVTMSTLNASASTLFVLSGP